MTDRIPSCATCRFCLSQDHGYSNWTVTDTSFHCLLDLNPKLEGSETMYEPDIYEDMTPELAEALDVAKTCPRYTDGAPVHLDIDQEDIPEKKTKMNPRTGRYPRLAPKDVVKYATGEEGVALANYINKRNGHD